MGLNDIAVYVDGTEATKARVTLRGGVGQGAGRASDRHRLRADRIAAALWRRCRLRRYDRSVAKREIAKRHCAGGVQGLRRSGRRERRGAAHAGYERGIPPRLRECRAPCRSGHPRPTTRRRSADRTICSGRTLPVRFRTAGHHRAGFAGKTRAQGNPGRGMGWKRRGGPVDQRCADLPAAGRSRRAFGRGHRPATRRSARL